MSKFDFDSPEQYQPNPQFHFEDPEGAPDEKEMFEGVPDNEGFAKKTTRNLLAGLAEGGRGSLQMLSDLAKRTEQMGDKISDISPFPQNGQQEGFQEYEQPSLSSAIQDRIQELAPKDMDYAQALGQEGSGTMLDRLMQGAAQYAPEIMGGASLARSGFRALPLTQKNAARPLQQAQKLAKEREVSPVQLSKNIFEEAPEFFDMKNPNVQKMLFESQEGGYEPVFSMQSDLGAEARNLRRSTTAAERRTAPRAEDLRQQILKELKEHLTNEGQRDIADMLTTGQKKYRQYKQLSEKVYPALRKAGVPLSLVTALGIGLKSTGKAAKEAFSD